MTVISTKRTTPSNYLVHRNGNAIGTIERIGEDCWHLILLGKDCGYWASFFDCKDPA